MMNAGNRHSTARPRCSRHAAGFTLLEILVSCLLLAAMVSLVVPLVSWTGAERRRLDQTQRAQLELDNLFEEVTLRPWDELAPNGFVAPQLSAACQEQLPQALLAMTIVDVPAADKIPPARRIDARLSWTPQDEKQRTLQLSAWVSREAP